MYVILVGQALVFRGGGGAEPSLPEKKKRAALGS